MIKHRCLEHAHYDNFDDKDVLRAALVAEQRGLCCYCLSRIHARWDGMKIEHWHCRKNYPSEQLDYSNLLAACLGSTGREQHCDTRKGDLDLSRNPADPAHRVEDLIHFVGDGAVKSHDPQFDRELNEVLNLNVAFLKNNRRAALQGLAESLPKQGAWSRSVLERHLKEWNGESHTGNLEPFCQVVVYWLRKRLSRV